MTICKHELRQGRIALLVWSVSISLMMLMCVLIFPEMAAEMGTVTKLFSNMGAFTAAFGMDKLNFGEFIGFFCIECGNVLGLCGGIFAAMIGAAALAKEEKDHTAEFLLTHPVSRTKIVAEKLLAVVLQIVILNLVVILSTVAGMAIIGENAPMKTMALLFLAYFIMQLEIAGITFGISAYLKNGSLGIGLGVAAIGYFLNIAANLSDKLNMIKYITPFGYTDGAAIVSDGMIPAGYLAVGCAMMVVGVLAAFWGYTRKDIAS